MKNRQNNRCFPDESLSSKGCELVEEICREWRRSIGYSWILAAAGTLMSGSTQAIQAQDGTDNTETLSPASGRPVRPRAARPLFFESRNRRLPTALGPLFSPPNLSGSDDCPGTSIPSGIYTDASPFSDNGDTTGANDTVTTVRPYYSYDAHGPDRIYSFVVTSIGANPEIKVTSRSATYRPMIYVSDRCPSGIGGILNDWNTSHFYSTKIAWSGDKSTVIGDWVWTYWDTLHFGQRLYLYIDSPVAGDSGPYTLTIKDMQISSKPKVERHARPDFDGDGLSDFAVFRPSDSTWYIEGSSRGFSSVQWGLPTDTLVPEDFDGDGRTDVAVYRNGVWHILGSSEGYIAVQWGLPNDIPVPGDYTGDGQSDLAIFRNGNWWVYDLTTGSSYSLNWGLPGDKPVPMDYDADGKIDPAVFRNGVWWWRGSLRDNANVQWGSASDKVVPGYYGNHNQADFSVYRNGTWLTLLPPYYFDVDGYVTMQWGLSTDIPVAGNFTNVWSADAGVFRDGAWWMRDCVGCSGSYVKQFGLPGDIPISGVYNR